MGTLTPLSDQLATRAKSVDFMAQGMLLPNPDPILRARGRHIAVYSELRADALVGGCIRRRKSAVKALDWGLDRGLAASRTTKEVQAILSDLDIERIIGQMLEATLYGYQPMEVAWQSAGKLLVPTDVQAKPPEWFCFDSESRLRFKTLTEPTLGELLPDKKFLLPRQDPTYQNPYGFADLSMCFWPMIFKKGGMKFWLNFAEKFGSAFLVGKLPLSADNEARENLLDSMEKMLQNGVAVIPDDGSVAPLEAAGKSASADLYEQLVMHCRGEIAIALLGQNQTTEASANKASAGAGLEVTKSLRDGDAEIVAAAMNQLIRWICEVNWSGAAAPVWSLWDQASQDQLQAARDKSNYEAGARYTNDYWMRAYGYQEGDLQPMVSAAPTLSAAAPSASAPVFAEAALSAASADPLQVQTNALLTTGTPQWASMVNQLQALVDTADSPQALQQAVVQAYGALDSGELVKLMAAALALAELKGMDAAAQGEG